MKPVEVQVTYDFICPWCWIGHHHLRAALEQSGVAVHLRYMPFELNPDMPVGGIDRKEYRTRKFGSWENSLAKDADLTARGKQAGAEFRFDLAKITPNSRLAHRLMRFVQAQDAAKQAWQLYDSIYAAYFNQGRDIGSLDVLVELAAASGFDAAEVRVYLESHDGEPEVAAQEEQARQMGVRGVPHFVIGAYQISGAQPVGVIVQALQAVAAQEALA
jgi:predicted DsbA family dithiol-disulfide isomerase